MSFQSDIRYALRMFRKNPGFTLAAIVALGLGIGASTSVFTIVNSVLLRPLPFQEPERLVSLWFRHSDGGRYPSQIVGLLDFRQRNRTFSSIGAFGNLSVNLTGQGEPERVRGVRISANFFQMVGIAAAQGRVFVPDDDAPGRPKIVLLSHALWVRRFGGDTGLIGKPIHLNGEAYTVVGVLRPEFLLPNNNPDVLVPLSPDTDPTRDSRTSISFLRVIARIKPGVTLQQAGDDVNSIAHRLSEEFPVTNGSNPGGFVVPVLDEVVGNFRVLLFVILGAVGLVLLVSCANIAGFLLARASERQKEVAIRSALGAGKWRVARQFLLESILLAAAGGGLGMLLSSWGVQFLLALSPTDLPRAAEIHVDRSVLLITMGVSLLCGLAFGCAPALSALKGDLNDALRGDGRGSTAGAGRNFSRRVLVGVEVALCMVLLVGAGLLLRSFLRLQNADLGFEPDHVLTARLALPRPKYLNRDTVAAFYRNLQPRIESLPGVQAAGVISILPLSGPLASFDFTIIGRPPLSGQETPAAHARIVDPGYFRAMGIPIVEGRGLNEHDTAQSQPVVVISQGVARRFWPDGGAVGAHLKIFDTDGGREVEIAGVVGDVRFLSTDEEPPPCVYEPLAQIPERVTLFLVNNLFWVMRTGSAPMGLESAVRREIRTADADVATASVQPMTDYLSRSVASRRFSVEIVAIFAAATLLLAATGLYALLAHSVTQRTREIGVRVALGARPREIFLLVMGEAAGLAVAGIVVGMASALLLTRLMAGLLYTISARDPLTISVVPVVLLVVAIAASYIPTRRAVRIDPAVALRRE